MLRNTLKIMGLAALAVAVLPTTAAAQASEADEWCDRERHGGDDDARVCEVREFTLPATGGRITVDGRTNGGISVEGWDGGEITVRARVSAHAREQARAAELLRGVEVMTAGGIRAEGPRTERREWWSVSYRLLVPRRSDLGLETMNGGIRIAGVDGHIEFHAMNGGVKLTDLSGDVRGRTTNGGLEVELSGAAWTGAGLDVETTNGGVTLRIPEDYSARIETGTVNGGIEVDFPVTVEGRIGRRLNFDIGDGGATLRASTTNGGVRIRRI